MQFYCLKDETLQQNSHIIKVYDVNRFQEAMWIVMELCDAGNLDEFFINYGAILKESEPKVKLMKQIINGIAFLHDKDIVHRDIKPGNILLKVTPERHAVVKIGDFGLSKILDPDCQTSAMTSNVSTFPFKAPELWKKNRDERIHYHRNVDVYSAGFTFTAMLQAEPYKKLMPRVEGELNPHEKEIPIGLAALHRETEGQPEIRKMTKVSPENRMSATEVESRISKMVRQRCLFIFVKQVS